MMKFEVEKVVRMLAQQYPTLGLDAERFLRDLEQLDGTTPALELKRYVDPNAEHQANNSEVDLIHYVQDLKQFMSTQNEITLHQFQQINQHIPPPLIAEIHLLIAEAYGQGVRAATMATVNLLSSMPL